MIHTKKWIIMSVLVIISVLTPNVSAKTYTSIDNDIMSSTYHSLFKNYFGDNKQYTYFMYKCTNNDHKCYYGIDKKGNYLNVVYNRDYGYSFETGVDENFVVNGKQVYNHNIDSDTYILYGLIFAGLFILLLHMF